jgi:hypothetical protein
MPTRYAFDMDQEREDYADNDLPPPWRPGIPLALYPYLVVGFFAFAAALLSVFGTHRHP